MRHVESSGVNVEGLASTVSDVPMAAPATEIVRSISSKHSEVETMEKAAEEESNVDNQAGFLKHLYDYQGGTFTPTETHDRDPSLTISNAQLNTIFGVYLPCVQNIIGVIVFIRLYWVVGVSGIIEGMIIIGLCCLCTFLTAISLAAGRNALFSRIDREPVCYDQWQPMALYRRVDPIFSSQDLWDQPSVVPWDSFSILETLWLVVCTCWVQAKFFSNTLVHKSNERSCFSSLDSSSTLFRCQLFGSSIENQQNAYNHYRLYGSILLVILGTIVFLGIKVVSRIGKRPFTPPSSGNELLTFI